MKPTAIITHINFHHTSPFSHSLSLSFWKSLDLKFFILELFQPPSSPLSLWINKATKCPLKGHRRTKHRRHTAEQGWPTLTTDAFNTKCENHPLSLSLFYSFEIGTSLKTGTPIIVLENYKKSQAAPATTHTYKLTPTIITGYGQEVPPTHHFSFPQNAAKSQNATKFLFLSSNAGHSMHSMAPTGKMQPSM